MAAMPLRARLLAVAEKLREESDAIVTGPGKACLSYAVTTYTPGQTRRFKLKRNLIETCEKLQRLALDAEGLE